MYHPKMGKSHQHLWNNNCHLNILGMTLPILARGFFSNLALGGIVIQVRGIIGQDVQWSTNKYFRDFTMVTIDDGYQELYTYGIFHTPIAGWFLLGKLPSRNGDQEIFFLN